MHSVCNYLLPLIVSNLIKYFVRVMDPQFIKSSRGKDVIIIENRKYCFSSVLKCNQKKWRCFKKTCRAKIFTENDIVVRKESVHNHAKDKAKIDKDIFFYKCKEKSLKCISEKPINIIRKSLKSVPNTITAIEVDSARKAMYRARRKQFPHNLPTTVTGVERKWKQKASNLPSTSNSGSDVPAIENPIQVTDILDQIVIKEETPDDDLGLILQCENVSDLDNVTIKEEPDEEPVEEPVPTVLNFVKEIQPVVFDLIVPEASTPTFNSDNIVRTYANVKKKPSTILSNQEDNISPEPLDKSCFNVVTQIDCDCKVSKKRPREKTEIPGSSKDFEESNNKFAGEICILCTKSSFEPLKDISSLLESKILFTADVMIHEHTLPKKACKPCVRMLDTCYKFKKQVLDSHKYICDQQESTVVPISERHTSSNADSLDDDEENTESDNDSSDECGSPHEPKKRILTYECIVCDSEFLNAPELEEHNILVHTKMDCKVCAFKPTNIIEHREHKKKHAPKQMGDKTKVCCEKCGEIVTKFRYTTHILEHDSKKVVECSVCNCSIPDTLLELHMKKHESKFVCEKCGTHFGDLRTYQRHIIKEHDRTFVCNICQKGFGDQPHLDKHIRLHSGEKPFACTVCDRKFNSKHNLATHVRIHTNTFPYKCNYCEESFRHNVTRKDHQKKVHSKELEEDKKLFVGGRQD